MLLRACTRVAFVAPALVAMLVVFGACMATDSEQTNTTMASPSSTLLPPPAPPQPDELEWERVTDVATTRPTVPQPEVYHPLGRLPDSVAEWRAPLP